MCTLTGPSLESPKKCRSKNKISYKHPWRHACLRPSQKPPSVFSSFPVSPKAPSKVHRGHSTPALHWHPVEAQNNPKPRRGVWLDISTGPLCQRKTLRTWHAWPDDLGVRARVFGFIFSVEESWHSQGWFPLHMNIMKWYSTNPPTRVGVTGTYLMQNPNGVDGS